VLTGVEVLEGRGEAAMRDFKKKASVDELHILNAQGQKAQDG